MARNRGPRRRDPSVRVASAPVVAPTAIKRPARQQLTTSGVESRNRRDAAFAQALGDLSTGLQRFAGGMKRRQDRIAKEEAEQETAEGIAWAIADVAARDAEFSKDAQGLADQATEGESEAFTDGYMTLWARTRAEKFAAELAGNFNPATTQSVEEYMNGPVGSFMEGLETNPVIVGETVRVLTPLQGSLEKAQRDAHIERMKKEVSDNAVYSASNAIVNSPLTKFKGAQFEGPQAASIIQQQYKDLSMLREMGVDTDAALLQAVNSLVQTGELHPNAYAIFQHPKGYDENGKAIPGAMFTTDKGPKILTAWNAALKRLEDSTEQNVALGCVTRKGGGINASCMSLTTGDRNKAYATLYSLAASKGATPGEAALQVVKHSAGNGFNDRPTILERFGGSLFDQPLIEQNGKLILNDTQQAALDMVHDARGWDSDRNKELLISYLSGGDYDEQAFLRDMMSTDALASGSDPKVALQNYHREKTTSKVIGRHPKVIARFAEDHLDDVGSSFWSNLGNAFDKDSHGMVQDYARSDILLEFSKQYDANRRQNLSHEAAFDAAVDGTTAAYTQATLPLIETDPDGTVKYDSTIDFPMRREDALNEAEQDGLRWIAKNAISKYVRPGTKGFDLRDGRKAIMLPINGGDQFALHWYNKPGVPGYDLVVDSNGQSFIVERGDLTKAYQDGVLMDRAIVQKRIKSGYTYDEILRQDLIYTIYGIDVEGYETDNSGTPGVPDGTAYTPEEVEKIMNMSLEDIKQKLTPKRFKTLERQMNNNYLRALGEPLVDDPIQEAQQAFLTYYNANKVVAITARDRFKKQHEKAKSFLKNLMRRAGVGTPEGQP